MGSTTMKEPERYTYADYLTWDDGERWELIDGKRYNMTPTPHHNHQLILGALLMQLYPGTKGKAWEIYMAVFDVRLPFDGKADHQVTNVVQPDISVFSDSSKLDERGGIGVPEFIIEILTPFTSRKDRHLKFNLYEKAGVKEYWLVSLEDELVEIYVLGADKKYGRPQRFIETDTVRLTALPGLTVDLSRVFPEKPEPEPQETEGPRIVRI